MTDPRALNTNQTNVNPSAVIQTLSLRAYSECVVCPHCHKVGFSRSEQKCNVISVVLFCCLPNCWYCYNVYKNKDLNCYDSEHKCSSCGTHISSYNAF